MTTKNLNENEEAQLEQAPKEESKFGNAWYMLKKNKAALVGLIIIIILLFIAVFGPLIMPYDPNI
ncbi:MAG: hypothetical protein MUO60_02140 [Clostridiaceae bacterium]|nr:hypothetical protein [Clostridiaceae bacterium]